MKYTRATALAAVSVAATLSLTACGGNGSAQDSSSKGSTSSSTSAPDQGSKPEGGSGSDGSEADSAKSGSNGVTEAEGTAADTTKSSGKVTFCRTKDLAIDAKNAAPDKVSGRIDITMVNRGSTTCSATGFAGVDIKDADNTSNPIARGHAEPRITTLKPGDAAVFDLAYDIDTTGGSLSSPTNILVTPPNETHTVSLTWPADAGDIKGAYTDVEVYPTHTTK
ncbi:DUF4232 domain-containing protein [Streptomyces sp. NPDC056796]|uniref:DUF4232 domain-containing protein n=1 Tax=unclassified Streptomyces TaxID=2593676 RepID=UPI003684C50D